MDFQECLKKELIKRNVKAVKRVDKTIEIAERFLKSGERNFEIGEYEISVIVCYNSLFQCCRALLFKKGYVERSHFCLITALRFLYKENKKLLEFLDIIDKIRLSRHSIQYRGEFSNKDEARFVLKTSKDFLNYISQGLRK